MIKIAIIIGGTRPGRHGEAVARWVHDLAVKRSDGEFEEVDVAGFQLPLLDEPMPASAGQYTLPHIRAWAAKIASADAYVFVTPEYNHSSPGALKNAIDFLYSEWNNKGGRFRQLRQHGRNPCGRAPAVGDGRASGRRRTDPGCTVAVH